MRPGMEEEEEEEEEKEEEEEDEDDKYIQYCKGIQLKQNNRY